MGHGPMTGRGAGFCAGHGVPGYANTVPGYGQGRPGRFGGHGRGFRHGYYATGLPGWVRRGAMEPVWPTYAPFEPPAGDRPADEAAALREQADYLTEALEEVRKRLESLESGSEE